MFRHPLIARRFSMKKLLLGAVIAPVIGAWFLFSVMTEGITRATDHWVESELQVLRLADTRAKQQAVVEELVLNLGPERAQDKLLHSGLPFTGDTHLVFHTVGTLLFEQYGLEGVVHCRPHFLGACYHGFLIEAVGQRGPRVIAAAWAQCRHGGAAMLPRGGNG
jgi:hypothetical protein